MTVREKAEYLNNQWTWFKYQEDEKLLELENLLSCPEERIEKAYDWYTSQSFDYMAYGEYLRCAINYIKGIEVRL